MIIADIGLFLMKNGVGLTGFLLQVWGCQATGDVVAEDVGDAAGDVPGDGKLIDITGDVGDEIGCSVFVFVVGGGGWDVAFNIAGGDCDVVGWGC